MARPCICPFCQTEVKKEEAFEYKRKYYHVDCFGVLSKQKTGIEKAKKKQQVERAKQMLLKKLILLLKSLLVMKTY